MNKTQQKFEELLKQIPPEVTEYVNLQGDIAVRIGEILEKKKWTQRQLAKEMGWQESQVTRLLAGHDNLTLKTIAKLSVVLGESIIQVAGKEKSEVEFLSDFDKRIVPDLLNTLYFNGFIKTDNLTVQITNHEFISMNLSQPAFKITDNNNTQPVSGYQENFA